MEKVLPNLLEIFADFEQFEYAGAGRDKIMRLVD
jgi:hypothetical protein